MSGVCAFPIFFFFSIYLKRPNDNLVEYFFYIFHILYFLVHLLYIISINMTQKWCKQWTQIQPTWNTDTTFMICKVGVDWSCAPISCRNCIIALCKGQLKVNYNHQEVMFCNSQLFRNTICITFFTKNKTTRADIWYITFWRILQFLLDWQVSPAYSIDLQFISKTPLFLVWFWKFVWM